MKRGFGWKPDRKDDRDHVFAAPHFSVALPPSADFHKLMPQPYDQGETNSCVGHAAVAPIHQKLRETDDWFPSPLFVYSNARLLGEGAEGLLFDEGCQIRDAMKGLAQWGICHNDDWPLSNSNMTVKPPQRFYDNAKRGLVQRYMRVPQEEHALKSLLAMGKAVVFGFNVFPEFEGDVVAKKGLLSKPKAGETLIGGHAVCLVGYRDDMQLFLVRNSYGTDWGLPDALGHFYMPYSYVTDPRLASDFWTVQSFGGIG